MREDESCIMLRSIPFRGTPVRKISKKMEKSPSKPTLGAGNSMIICKIDEAFKLNVYFEGIEHHVRRRWILFEV